VIPAPSVVATAAEVVLLIVGRAVLVTAAVARFTAEAAVWAAVAIITGVEVACTPVGPALAVGVMGSSVTWVGATLVVAFGAGEFSPQATIVKFIPNIKIARSIK